MLVWGRFFSSLILYTVTIPCHNRQTSLKKYKYHFSLKIDFPVKYLETDAIKWTL